MAQRRMFSPQITESDAFIEMPLSSQALYFHLCMNADDDGFVKNPKSIQRLVGGKDKDYTALVDKRFILGFPSGVIVIKHWRMHNLLRKDRYKKTVYTEEKATLFLKPDGGYTFDNAQGVPVPEYADGAEENGEQNDNQPSTDWQPNGNQMATQVRLGKDKVSYIEESKKVSKNEGRKIDKNKSSNAGAREDTPETYDSIMEQYGIGGAVRVSTIEFIRHCQINKKTLTNDALKRILQSLITYPTDEEKIKVFQKAVDENKFTIQPKAELHDDGFGTASAFAGKTYQDILDGDLVRLAEPVKSKLWEFIRHCKANGLVLTNNRLFDLCMKLNRQYGYGKSAEQIEALDRAIAGGYFDIKTEETIAEQMVHYDEMTGRDPLWGDVGDSERK